ncbi:ArnT family glycosyltransferase [Nocardia kruczakiae]|uniref:ArnT family glycosyltransferase n=1 Tax=Nocardia kruczakiae TaxID=261477 RepID=UPI0007A51C86|nr:glycosyltransferase family 39 protein [Nocardia kruczakiae]
MTDRAPSRSETSSAGNGFTDAVARRDSSSGAVWVGVVAVLAAAVLVARSARYDWFGDELYFVAAGYHAAAGYVDQGPLIPLLARAAQAVAPDSLTVLRLPAILAGVGAIVVTAALAREFGGGRAAWTLAAVGYACCPYVVTQTASLSTFALDSTAVAVLAWLSARWVRTRADRLLLIAGVVAAIDLQVKLLLPVVVGAFAVGIACCGPREIVRRPALWAAAGIAAVSAAPALLWQERHGWPQLAMGAVIRDEQRAATGGTAGLPVQLVTMAGVLGVVLIGCAAWGFAGRRLRDHRFLAVAVCVMVVFVALTGGRPYYLAGLLPVLFAAGACVLVERLPARWSRVTACAAATVSIVIALAVVLLWPSSDPPRAVTTRAELSTRMRGSGTTGWDALVAGASLAAERAGPDHAPTAILTRTYWQAAALARFGPRELPPVYSPDRGFAEFGRPPPGTTTVIYVDTDTAETRLRRTFSTVEPLVRLDDPRGFPGIDAHVTIWRCTGPRDTWARLWPELTTDILDPGI